MGSPGSDPDQVSKSLSIKLEIVDDRIRKCVFGLTDQNRSETTHSGEIGMTKQSRLNEINLTK